PRRPQSPWVKGLPPRSGLRRVIEFDELRSDLFRVDGIAAVGDRLSNRGHLGLVDRRSGLRRGALEQALSRVRQRDAIALRGRRPALGGGLGRWIAARGRGDLAGRITAHIRLGCVVVANFHCLPVSLASAKRVMSDHWFYRGTSDSVRLSVRVFRPLAFCRRN